MSTPTSSFNNVAALESWCVQRFLHPVVVVEASRAVDRISLKNGLTFIQLLRPFSTCQGPVLSRVEERKNKVVSTSYPFGARLVRSDCVHGLGSYLVRVSEEQLRQLVMMSARGLLLSSSSYAPPASPSLVDQGILLDIVLQNALLGSQCGSENPSSLSSSLSQRGQSTEKEKGEMKPTSTTFPSLSSSSFPLVLQHLQELYLTSSSWRGRRHEEGSGGPRRRPQYVSSEPTLILHDGGVGGSGGEEDTSPSSCVADPSSPPFDAAPLSSSVVPSSSTGNGKNGQGGEDLGVSRLKSGLTTTTTSAPSSHGNPSRDKNKEKEKEVTTSLTKKDAIPLSSAASSSSTAAATTTTTGWSEMDILMQSAHPTWYPHFLLHMFSLIRCGSADTLDYPVGILYAVSTREGLVGACNSGGGGEALVVTTENWKSIVLQNIRKEILRQYTLVQQRVWPPAYAATMDNDVHSYFVLVHDDDTFTGMEAGEEEEEGEACCSPLFPISIDDAESLLLDCQALTTSLGLTEAKDSTAPGSGSVSPSPAVAPLPSSLLASGATESISGARHVNSSTTKSGQRRCSSWSLVTLNSAANPLRSSLPTGGRSRMTAGSSSFTSSPSPDGNEGRRRDSIPARGSSSSTSYHQRQQSFSSTPSGGGNAPVWYSYVENREDNVEEEGLDPVLWVHANPSFMDVRSEENLDKVAVTAAAAAASNHVSPPSTWKQDTAGIPSTQKSAPSPYSLPSLSFSVLSGMFSKKLPRAKVVALHSSPPPPPSPGRRRRRRNSNTNRRNSNSSNRSSHHRASSSNKAGRGTFSPLLSVSSSSSLPFPSRCLTGKAREGENLFITAKLSPSLFRTYYIPFPYVQQEVNRVCGTWKISPSHLASTPNPTPTSTSRSTAATTTTAMELPMYTGCFLTKENAMDLQSMMTTYLAHHLAQFIQRRVSKLAAIIRQRRTTTLGKFTAWLRSENAKSKLEVVSIPCRLPVLSGNLASRRRDWKGSSPWNSIPPPPPPSSSVQQEQVPSSVREIGGQEVLRFSANSIEMQMRRCGDCCLFLQDFDGAESNYKLCCEELLETAPMNKSLVQPLLGAVQEGISLCQILKKPLTGGLLLLPSLPPPYHPLTASQQYSASSSSAAFAASGPLISPADSFTNHKCSGGVSRLDISFADYYHAFLGGDGEEDMFPYLTRLSLLAFELCRTHIHPRPAMGRAVTVLRRLLSIPLLHQRCPLWSAVFHQLLAGAYLYMNPPEPSTTQPTSMTRMRMLGRNTPLMLRSWSPSPARRTVSVLSHLRRFVYHLHKAGSRWFEESPRHPASAIAALYCYRRLFICCKALIHQEEVGLFSENDAHEIEEDGSMSGGGGQQQQQPHPRPRSQYFLTCGLGKDALRLLAETQRSGWKAMLDEIVGKLIFLLALSPDHIPQLEGKTGWTPTAVSLYYPSAEVSSMRSTIPNLISPPPLPPATSTISTSSTGNPTMASASPPPSPSLDLPQFKTDLWSRWESQLLDAEALAVASYAITRSIRCHLDYSGKESIWKDVHLLFELQRRCKLSSHHILQSYFKFSSSDSPLLSPPLSIQSNIRRKMEEEERMATETPGKRNDEAFTATRGLPMEEGEEERRRMGLDAFGFSPSFMSNNSSTSGGGGEAAGEAASSPPFVTGFMMLPVVDPHSFIMDVNYYQMDRESQWATQQGRECFGADLLDTEWQLTEGELQEYFESLMKHITVNAEGQSPPGKVVVVGGEGEGEEVKKEEEEDREEVARREVSPLLSTQGHEGTPHACSPGVPGLVTFSCTQGKPTGSGRGGGPNLVTPLVLTTTTSTSSSSPAFPVHPHLEKFVFPPYVGDASSISVSILDAKIRLEHEKAQRQQRKKNYLHSYESSSLPPYGHHRTTSSFSSCSTVMAGSMSSPLYGSSAGASYTFFASQDAHPTAPLASASDREPHGERKASFSTAAYVRSHSPPPPGGGGWVGPVPSLPPLLFTVPQDQCIWLSVSMMNPLEVPLVVRDLALVYLIEGEEGEKRFSFPTTTPSARTAQGVSPTEDGSTITHRQPPLSSTFTSTFPCSSFPPSSTPLRVARQEDFPLHVGFPVRADGAVPGGNFLPPSSSSSCATEGGCGSQRSAASHPPCCPTQLEWNPFEKKRIRIPFWTGSLPTVPVQIIGLSWSLHVPADSSSSPNPHVYEGRYYFASAVKGGVPPALVTLPPSLSCSSSLPLTTDTNRHEGGGGGGENSAETGAPPPPPPSSSSSALDHPSSQTSFSLGSGGGEGRASPSTPEESTEEHPTFILSPPPPPCPSLPPPILCAPEHIRFGITPSRASLTATFSPPLPAQLYDGEVVHTTLVIKNRARRCGASSCCVRWPPGVPCSPCPSPVPTHQTNPRHHHLLDGEGCASRTPPEAHAPLWPGMGGAPYARHVTIQPSRNNAYLLYFPHYSDTSRLSPWKRGKTQGTSSHKGEKKKGEATRKREEEAKKKDGNESERISRAAAPFCSVPAAGAVHRRMEHDEEQTRNTTLLRGEATGVVWSPSCPGEGRGAVDLPTRSPIPPQEPPLPHLANSCEPPPDPYAAFKVADCIGPEEERRVPVLLRARYHSVALAAAASPPSTTPGAGSSPSAAAPHRLSSSPFSNDIMLLIGYIPSACPSSGLHASRFPEDTVASAPFVAQRMRRKQGSHSLEEEVAVVVEREKEDEEKRKKCGTITTPRGEGRWRRKNGGIGGNTPERGEWTSLGGEDEGPFTKKVEYGSEGGSVQDQGLAYSCSNQDPTATSVTTTSSRHRSSSPRTSSGNKGNLILRTPPLSSPPAAATSPPQSDWGELWHYQDYFYHPTECYLSSLPGKRFARRGKPHRGTTTTTTSSSSGHAVPSFPFIPIHAVVLHRVHRRVRVMPLLSIYASVLPPVRHEMKRSTISFLPPSPTTQAAAEAAAAIDSRPSRLSSSCTAFCLVDEEKSTGAARFSPVVSLAVKNTMGIRAASPSSSSPRSSTRATPPNILSTSEPLHRGKFHITAITSSHGPEWRVSPAPSSSRPAYGSPPTTTTTVRAPLPLSQIPEGEEETNQEAVPPPVCIPCGGAYVFLFQVERLSSPDEEGREGMVVMPSTSSSTSLRRRDGGAPPLPAEGESPTAYGPFPTSAVSHGVSPSSMRYSRHKHIPMTEGVRNTPAAASAEKGCTGGVDEGYPLVEEICFSLSTSSHATKKGITEPEITLSNSSRKEEEEERGKNHSNNQTHESKSHLHSELLEFDPLSAESSSTRHFLLLTSVLDVGRMAEEGEEEKKRSSSSLTPFSKEVRRSGGGLPFYRDNAGRGFQSSSSSSPPRAWSTEHYHSRHKKGEGEKEELQTERGELSMTTRTQTRSGQGKNGTPLEITKEEENADDVGMTSKRPNESNILSKGENKRRKRSTKIFQPQVAEGWRMDRELHQKGEKSSSSSTLSEAAAVEWDGKRMERYTPIAFTVHWAIEEEISQDPTGFPVASSFSASRHPRARVRIRRGRLYFWVWPLSFLSTARLAPPSSRRPPLWGGTGANGAPGHLPYHTAVAAAPPLSLAADPSLSSFSSPIENHTAAVVVQGNLQQLSADEEDSWKVMAVRRDQQRSLCRAMMQGVVPCTTLLSLYSWCGYGGAVVYAVDFPSPSPSPSSSSSSAPLLYPEVERGERGGRLVKQQGECVLVRPLFSLHSKNVKWMSGETFLKEYPPNEKGMRGGRWWKAKHGNKKDENKEEEIEEGKRSRRVVVGFIPAFVDMTSFSPLPVLVQLFVNPPQAEKSFQHWGRGSLMRAPDAGLHSTNSILVHDVQDEEEKHPLSHVGKEEEERRNIFTSYHYHLAGVVPATGVIGTTTSTTFSDQQEEEKMKKNTWIWESGVDKVGGRNVWSSSPFASTVLVLPGESARISVELVVFVEVVEVEKRSRRRRMGKKEEGMTMVGGVSKMDDSLSKIASEISREGGGGRQQQQKRRRRRRELLIPMNPNIFHLMLRPLTFPSPHLLHSGMTLYDVAEAFLFKKEKVENEEDPRLSQGQRCSNNKPHHHRHHNDVRSFMNAKRGGDGLPSADNTPNNSTGDEEDASSSSFSTSCMDAEKDGKQRKSTSTTGSSSSTSMSTRVDKEGEHEVCKDEEKEGESVGEGEGEGGASASGIASRRRSVTTARTGSLAQSVCGDPFASTARFTEPSVEQKLSESQQPQEEGEGGDHLRQSSGTWRTPPPLPKVKLTPENIMWATPESIWKKSSSEVYALLERLTPSFFSSTQLIALNTNPESRIFFVSTEEREEVKSSVLEKKSHDVIEEERNSPLSGREDGVVEVVGSKEEGTTLVGVLEEKEEDSLSYPFHIHSLVKTEVCCRNMMDVLAKSSRISLCEKYAPQSFSPLPLSYSPTGSSPVRFPCNEEVEFSSLFNTLHKVSELLYS